ncbi:unnamed protein product [Sphagnum jensenii]|uniref:CCHC-type domain-containing protein n=1 Tax=Sphagnum jensenii TaxID=128206 RepID=A0ABP0WU74_9BRYO
MSRGCSNVSRDMRGERRKRGASVQGAMAMDDGRPRRRTGRREEERSPTPVSDGTAEEEEDDEEEGELGTADLTLDILRKARLRGLPRKEGEKARNGDGGDATFGGRAAMDGGRSLRVWEEARAVADAGPLEDGEIITNDAEEEVDALAQLEEPPPVAAATGKKKRKKSGKKKKETGVVVPEMSDRKIIKLEDTATPTTEGELEGAEESLVMRKLLRGPRYFDPPEEQGESCYNCGQIGHHAAACTEQPRQKPCYVCGNFGHEGYDCPQRTECYMCGKFGHMARACPNKRLRIGRRSGANICLLCGGFGHEAAACFGDYDPEDFKKVHCYICKQPGHLSCVEIVDASPTPVSCYQCGEVGHTGETCTRQERQERQEKHRHGFECYKCGLEGHIARECKLINQKRHSWPAPWPEDNGQPWKSHQNSGDQEPTRTGKYNSGEPSRHQERMFSSETKKGKRSRVEDEDAPTERSKRSRRFHTKELVSERWTPKPAGAFSNRLRD